ncbi:MAG: PAS domain S-box protein [Candidatus Protochlamydia sp.]|nr:PAS domain S-box protein [Candidatus Protochlamydia sp.]
MIFIFGKIFLGQTLFDSQSSFLNWEILIIGAFLCALIGICLLAVNRKCKQIKQEFQSRTEELDTINRLLQQEIHERQKIEEDYIHKQHYLQRRHEALVYLTKFTTSELKNAINEVLLRTASVLEVDRTSIWFYEERNSIPILSCAGMYVFSSNSFTNDLEFVSTEFPHYFKALGLYSHLILPSNNADLNQELLPYMTTFQIISKLVIPITFEGHLLGVLCCEETRNKREWLLEDRHFGQTIADIIAIMIEQSAKRKAEKALQDSEEKLRFLTQKAIDAIISFTTEGRIVSWNFGAEKMFGFSEEEMTGKSLDAILSYQEVLKAKGSDKPIELLGKNKSDMVFSVELSHTRWKSGAAYLDTVIIRNITERKEYEKQLINAIKEAKLANEAKNEFLTTISHELRTPLNAIIGFDQCLLMEMDGPISDQQASSLKKIEISAFHLLSLINDILDLAKIESKKQHLHLSSENIVKLLGSCIDEIRPLAEQKNLKIDLTFDKPYLLIDIDIKKIKQVLLNLLGNAVKFTEKGKILVELIDRLKEIEIKISDTGIGLTPLEIKKIFKPFSQADSTITRKYGGTGLGLAISKKIIGLHKGSIRVESEKGVGSAFIIKIPKKIK